MTAIQNNPQDEAAIRAIIEEIRKAVREKNVEGMLAQSAEHVSTYDMMPPLKHKGKDAIRALWKKSLAPFVGPLDYDVHHLELYIGDNVAFSKSLNRFGGKLENGEYSATWICSTLGFQKIEEQWKIIHEHVSVPADPETGMAMFDLQPTEF